MRMCSIFDAFSTEAVIDWGDHPGWDEYCEELNIRNHLNVFGELLLSYEPRLSIDDSCVRLFTAQGRCDF